MARSRETLKADPSFGLDSTWSWVTAAFLSWVFCVAMIAQQAMGVLFYGILDSFGVNRQKASWPVVLSGSLLNLAGPLFGYLCQRFSSRSVLFVSTFVAGASTSICWYATSVLFLTIAYGIVHGLASSGTTVAVNVLASQHFERRRTTACSIIFTVCGLGILFVPPLAEFFREEYGVRGTFLLLGGLIFNACPAVIVLRSPVWMQLSTTAPDTRNPELPEGTTDVTTTRLLPVHSVDGEIISEETGTNSRGASKVGAAETNVAESGAQNLKFLQAGRPPTNHAKIKVSNQSSFTAVAGQLFKTLFIVNSLSFSVVVVSLITFMLVSVDIATDRGVTPSRAVFLLNAFAASDIVFRPISGMVIDSGLLKLETVMLAGYVLQALAFELFVWVRSFPMMLVCSTLIGVSNGARVFLQAPVLVRDFGIESLPLTMGVMSFCIGIAGLARPLLVGYFRDYHGSYDGLFHILAAVNALLVVIWAVRLAVTSGIIMGPTTASSASWR
ncbi:monocarboxylate transporter 14-like isoform X2 [Haemaphysalis longicornis]